MEKIITKNVAVDHVSYFHLQKIKGEDFVQSMDLPSTNHILRGIISAQFFCLREDISMQL